MSLLKYNKKECLFFPSVTPNRYVCAMICISIGIPTWLSWPLDLLVFPFFVMFLQLDLNSLSLKSVLRLQGNACVFVYIYVRVPARVCVCSRVCEYLAANLNNDNDINAPFSTVVELVFLAISRFRCGIGNLTSNKLLWSKYIHIRSAISWKHQQQLNKHKIIQKLL